MAAKVQFLTNEKGERVSVVLPVAEYEELLEDLGGFGTYRRTPRRNCHNA